MSTHNDGRPSYAERGNVTSAGGETHILMGGLRNLITIYKFMQIDETIELQEHFKIKQKNTKFKKMAWPRDYCQRSTHHRRVLHVCAGGLRFDGRFHKAIVGSIPLMWGRRQRV